MIVEIYEHRYLWIWDIHDVYFCVLDAGLYKNVFTRSSQHVYELKSYTDYS